jgi:microcystin-dependent protein
MAQVMADILDDMNEYGEAIVIGAILPYMSDDPPPHTLKCDGATYNRVNYPRLYAALSPVFQLTADTFFVPDLRSQFVMGAANDGEIGNNGGEAEHTLSVSEIPAHSHTNTPHTHSDTGHIHSIGGAVTTLAFEPGEMLVLTPSPLPGATSLGYAGITASGVTIDNTGGSEAHNNLPPYTKLNYCVLAE